MRRKSNASQTLLTAWCLTFWAILEGRSTFALFGKWNHRHHASALMMTPQTRQKAPSRIDLTLRGGANSIIESADTDAVEVPIKVALDYQGETPPTRALIIMDGFCPYHGVYLAHRAKEYEGVAVIHVLSDYLRGYLQATNPDPEWDEMRIPVTKSDLAIWEKMLQGIDLVGLYCESDSGLADAEALRDRLKLRVVDAPIVSEARRNKFLMNEVVSKSGLRTAKQQLCESIEEAISFAAPLLKSDGRVIVKPFRGVGSDSVRLCRNREEVEGAFANIVDSPVFGSKDKHGSALVQEFLDGTEYAVDVVSRDGEHKIAAVWRYDKRPVNDAPFCYFQTLLVDPDSDPRVKEVCTFVNSALDALGVKWGMSHTEVMVSGAGSPALIEVNCRQHNMDFCPLSMACIGYNSLDLLLEAYFGTLSDWQQYPSLPALRLNGCMVHLVNFNTGKLKELHHLEDIQSLPSVFCMTVYDPFLALGEDIEPTVDIKTDAGWVQLINPDKELFDSDYRKIVEYMPFIFEVEEEDGRTSS